MTAIVYYCDRPRCPGWTEAPLLVAHIRGEEWCSRCFRRERPEVPPCTRSEAEMARQATVKRMQERGGADAHLVRKGLT